MLSVGLTGNVGSGKSSVAARWAASGVPVVDADDLARRAVAPGTAALEAIRSEFGADVIAADGTLDRPRLRSIVFDDDEARARLEAIVHPEVARLRDAWMRERRAEGHRLVVSEIPLLFETGRERDFDVVVLVDASPEARLQRIVEGRGIGRDEARRMMAAQMDPDQKRPRADIVIDNHGSLADLDDEADRVLGELRGLAGQAPMRVDLHLHTWGSWDCLSDPEAVLERARSLGYGRIAITDHNRLGVALRMAETHPQEVIPGEEIKTAEGVDVIGLYLSDEIPRGTPARATIEQIREQGGVPYLPHPYAGGKGGGGKLADILAPLCDVVEVFNARLHSDDLNARAADLAARHGKRCGAGSDAHTVGEIGNAYIDVPPHANRPDALLSALAESARAGGSAASRLVHLASTWAKVRKRLPAPPGAEVG